MRQTVQLFKVWGIPIGFNTSWFLIFGLVTFSLAAGYMPEAYPALGVATYWILALVTSILFFGSVLFHELAHAFFALRHNIKVKQITLFIFGGVAEMEEEPKSPWAEFVIAIAGPISSFVAAAFFFGLYQLDQQFPLLAAPTEYLIRINLILAVFNLIPGFPLDGGRVLRAIVWYFSDYRKATNIAATTGRVVAYGFMGIGVFQVFGGDVFNGLWLVFIGWFLQNSASSHQTFANMKSILEGTTVEPLMQPGYEIVDGKMPISSLVDNLVSRGGPRYYFVKQTGFGIEERAHPNGMLTMTDISGIGKDKWRLTTAERLMVAWNKLITVEIGESLLNSLRIMDEHRVNQLPVLSQGNLVGVLTRESVANHLRLRTELGS